jgi:hypothetical protein
MCLYMAMGGGSGVPLVFGFIMIPVAWAGGVWCVSRVVRRLIPAECIAVIGEGVVAVFVGAYAAFPPALLLIGRQLRSMGIRDDAMDAAALLIAGVLFGLVWALALLIAQWVANDPRSTASIAQR